LNYAVVAPLWYKTTTVSDANAQFSVDILNYTDFDFVYVNVTVNPVFGNLGYNWTQIDVVGFPGGRWQDGICGVPYDVNITAPPFPPISTVTGGVAFPITYEILDRNYLLAPGYYTYPVISPDRGFVNISAGPIAGGPGIYTAPADQIFDGLVTGGIFTGFMTIFGPGGFWWINASEGGQIWPDTFYLTDWDNWFLDPFATIPGWLKDWDNITVDVQVNYFSWRLSAGWNMVSCPQNATHRVGANPFFDSQDALNWTNMELFILAGVYDPNLAMAMRTGGNPSTYDVYDVDTGEAGFNFAIDSISGYWVYTSLPGPYVIDFNSLNETTTGIFPPTQDAPLAAGWNLMGFQHNYTLIPWAPLTASDFTDGTLDLSGFLWHADLGGARTKLVITLWTYGKWYDSYVVDTGFPGMPTHDWVWDTTYSLNPGNGLWIWSDAAGIYTYSTVW
jgi:hypothetical protein